MVVSHSSTGNIYLKDKYSHFLLHSIPVGQLVHFNERKIYKISKNNIELSEEVNEESETDMKESCQRVVPSFPKDLCNCNLTSMPIKSQIVIMSSTENPLSSDESINIDVGLESTELNPLESVDVSYIPMEIVENLFDDGDDSLNNVTVIDSCGSVQRKFVPLTDEQR